jgi:dihydrofolate synthase/folylpolyglutamate synthase
MPPKLRQKPTSGSDEILDRLVGLHPKKIDLSLGRVVELLDKLGRPQAALPPVIHVGGTNGKGSTIAFMRAMLEAAGKSVHVYTSPHLVRFHERIRLGAAGGGHFVGEAELSAALAECERVNDGRPITLFEMTTAAAFKLFHEHPADYLLLEVGLGGRYDATNVIDPLASVITPSRRRVFSSGAGRPFCRINHAPFWMFWSAKRTLWGRPCSWRPRIF